MTTLARARRRPALAAAAPAAPEGIVTAIVAVTSHEDSVKDIIVPGAFADTLTKLRPKLCWHHDWKDPLGRVLHIAEVKPGDKRLPKTLPDGRAWPANAGALIATMQFNLRTTRGRDMFEHCKEWAKNGEAAFSIGYRVVEGMSSKRADGVRLIYQLDLFEVSLVLHGAHNMALALEVKDLADAAMPGIETKDTPTGITEVKAAEPMIGAGAMVALYIDPETAGQLAAEDGNPAEELHVTLAFLGGDDVASSMDPPSIDRMVQEIKDHIAGIGELSGSVGGIGVFPEGPDGTTPVWVPVDVPRLEVLRERVVEACEAGGFPQSSEHGYTPHMTLGYDLPSLEPVPRTPVAFNEVTLVVGGQRFPIPLGRVAAPAPIEGKAHAAVTEALAHANRLEGKSAAAAVLEAKTMFSGSAGAVTVPTLTEPEKVSGQVKRTPRKKDPQEGMEAKMMSQMKGSHEEKREALRNALEKLLLPDRKSEPGGIVSDECGWLSIEATFDDTVLVTVEKGRESTSYQVPWAVGADNDEIELGKAIKVELSVVAIPEDGKAEAAEEGEAVQMRFIDPATAFITDATRRISAMPEGKSLAGIEGPLLALMDALAVKGFDVAGAVMGDEPDPDAEAVEVKELPVDGEPPESGAEAEVRVDPVEPVADPEEEHDEDGADAEGDEPKVNPSKDTVTLDAETVRAQLAELHA